MNLNTYNSLYKLSLDDRKSTKNNLLQNIFVVFFWLIVSIFFISFLHTDPNLFSICYYFFYLTIELLFLLCAIYLYESTQFTITFLKNVPISEKKIFWFHYISSSCSLSYLLELITIISVLLFFNIKISLILLIIVGIIAIKFSRTYCEFLIVFLNSREKKFPTWTIIFFISSVLLYIFAQKGVFGSFRLYSLFLDSLYFLVVISILGVSTYKVIIKKLLTENTNSGNSVIFRQGTNLISKYISSIFKYTPIFRSTFKIQLVRLFRDTQFLSKTIGIGSTLFIFSTVNDVFISKFLELEDDPLSNILYIAFLASFISFANIRLDYQLSKRYQLSHFPIHEKIVKLTVDLSHALFLYILISFIFLIQFSLNKITYNTLGDGYIIFTCFYFLSLSIEPTNLVFNKKSKKTVYYLKFFTLGIIIEFLFYIHVILIIKLILTLICFFWMYYKRYIKR